jgi:hypothetical protein
METGATGWYSVDESATRPGKFHVSSYFAYDDKSYWCGEQNTLYAGGDGYGDRWDERLNLPPVHWDGAIYPVFTFKYRHDSEPAHDFTYVEAESLEVFERMNRGYDGSSGGWQDIGTYGYLILHYDEPFICRFRFVSDLTYSDADGDYDSDAGAFHCDDLEVFDFFRGTTYFFDDAGTTTGPFCVPSGPEPAGDYWHIVYDDCSSFSQHRAWWCGDDGDTTWIPAGLFNALYSPPIDISSCSTCTLFWALHAEVPVMNGDYWMYRLSVDGGNTFVAPFRATWMGDHGQCDYWDSYGLTTGFVIEDEVGPPPWGDLVFKIIVYTDANGCGPGAGGAAGVVFDDFWVFGDCASSGVEIRRDTSWGVIKRMFKD